MTDDIIIAAFEEIEENDKKGKVQKYNSESLIGVSFSELYSEECEKDIDENVDEEIKIKLTLLRIYKLKAESYGDVTQIPESVLHTINILTNDISKQREQKAKIEAMSTNQIVSKIKFIETFIGGFVNIVKSTVSDRNDRRRLLQELRLHEEASKKKAALTT